ncbi:hypothetical protein FA95DRAFT_1607590 [Auriscalpium vulgare]|uniref:Uncharacterized protein n=1 Tax=Auriscalpium vulgare TaxID=40419 RepID=A0ACB8RNP9_9AGAM|nr:hypothetical protein FA95DRAFT_1607590 [Auriscalpium vulgare]
MGCEIFSSLPDDAIIVTAGAFKFYIGTERSTRNADTCGPCHEAEAPCLVGAAARATCVLCSLRRKACLSISEYHAGPVRRGRGRAQKDIAVHKPSKRPPARASMRIVGATTDAVGPSAVVKDEDGAGDVSSELMEARIQILVDRRVQAATERLRAEFTALAGL